VRLAVLHVACKLRFFGRNEGRAEQGASAALIRSERQRDWVVHATRDLRGLKISLACGRSQSASNILFRRG
jgi:hypothetical protein